MIIRNDLKGTNLYKIRLNQYKQHSKKKFGPEIFGLVGGGIILLVLILNNPTFLGRFFFGGSDGFTGVHIFISRLIGFGLFACLIPGFILFMRGMFGKLDVYEIHIDNMDIFSKMIRVINGEGVFSEDIFVYENEIKYHFVESPNISLEIGKTYFVAGKGQNLYFVLKEKN